MHTRSVFATHASYVFSFVQRAHAMCFFLFNVRALQTDETSHDNGLLWNIFYFFLPWIWFRQTPISNDQVFTRLFCSSWKWFRQAPVTNVSQQIGGARARFSARPRRKFGTEDFLTRCIWFRQAPMTNVSQQIDDARRQRKFGNKRLLRVLLDVWF